MPRDSSDTNTRLLDESERLFASRGVYAVTNREITEAAEQKNVSALNYHFGSRAELLGAVLSRRGAELERRRAELSVGLGEDSETRELVALLVQVYASCLESPWGRDYVRVVDQLRAGLTDWRTGASADDGHLQMVLDILEGRPADVSIEVRRQRLVAMMMLMTGLVAARAQHIADNKALDLPHDHFVETLTDILVGILTAPVAEPAH